jgi:hypothetical protein
MNSRRFIFPITRSPRRQPRADAVSSWRLQGQGSRWTTEHGEPVLRRADRSLERVTGAGDKLYGAMVCRRCAALPPPRLSTSQVERARHTYIPHWIPVRDWTTRAVRGERRCLDDRNNSRRLNIRSGNKKRGTHAQRTR